jgi:tRNA(adenine34) deaminase
MEEKDHEYFMKKAVAMAELGYEQGEVPVGAVLVCDGKIISKAHNQVELLHDATAHAEMLVITSACAHFQSKYLKDCTLYVSLEPCPMCAAALYWTQVKSVIWGAPDEKRGFSLFDPGLLHPSTETQSGILAQESSILMKQFFRERRGTI